MGDRPDHRIAGTVVRLGGVGLGRGGGGGGRGGVGGLGGGDGLRRPCGGGGGGGFGLLPQGIAPSSVSSDDSKGNFCFLAAGWGGLGCGLAWGGGVLGRWWWTPPPLPPPPPRRSPHPLPCSPTSSDPPHLHTPPPASEPTLRPGSGATSPRRRSPHARSPGRGDRASEQGPGVDTGPRCGVGPPRVLPGSPQRRATPPKWAWHASHSPRCQSRARTKKKCELIF